MDQPQPEQFIEHWPITSLPVTEKLQHPRLAELVHHDHNQGRSIEQNQGPPGHECAHPSCLVLAEAILSLLIFDAANRVGSRFKALYGDFLATIDASSIRTGIHASQRVIHLNQDCLEVAL